MNRTTRKIQPTGNIMHRVSLALLPGALAMAWQYGAGVIWNLVWLVALCALVESSAAACVTDSSRLDAGVLSLTTAPRC